MIRFSLTFFVVATFALVSLSSASGTTIDFETLPDGSPTTVGFITGDEWLSLGVELNWSTRESRVI